MTNPQSGGTPWYFKRLTILIGLICFYPVAVVLLRKSPRHRTWEKIAGTLFFFPVFAGLVLLALYPFWDFGGGLQLVGCSLDLGRIRQYDRLEQHRARQRESDATTDASLADDSQWTDFRGPNRDGVVTGASISLDWNANPPSEIYRQPIGEGYASFVVANGRAYTLEQRRDNEAVTCYDVATGREIWIFEYEARFEETLGGEGPRATPTLHGDRLYTLGAAGDLQCLSTKSGEPIWARKILTENGARNLQWG
ncbi:MAG: PQQ-binding-like beta-propeller repeat protein, partial [Planctomycetota bacterium]|nr:PQQ-binding-like beta-propeller repeat protein [Planctomycetota bacterium]